MKHSTLSIADKRFITENVGCMYISEMSNEIKRGYSTIYKFIERENMTILKQNNRGSSSRKHYTRTYPAKLFNAIKQLERDLTTSSTKQQRDHIENMRQEYKHAIESDRTDTSRYKYQNLGPSVMHLWHPKVTIVNR